MYDSWLEAWELPMPSTAAWEEKETAEQVQESHETDTLIGTYLLGDADLIKLEPSCEDPRMDLTAIIGSLLDCEEPASGDLSALTTKAGDGVTFNSTYDITELVLQCQPDGWLDSDQPVTVDLSDLIQVPADITEEEYCQSFEYEEGIGVVAAVSELPVADKRKSARKRKVFEPADDIGWQNSTDDESTCWKKAGSSGEKKSKTSQGVALDKGSPEYRMRRDRNNKFVRASREKARRRHQEVEENLSHVVGENKQLRSRVETLTREVEILRGLFVSIGAEIPRDVVARINIATQPLPPSNM